MNINDSANKEFVDEEITKIISDAIFNVFGLRVKYENSENKIVEFKIENEKDKTIISSLFYNKEKALVWSNQITDQCLRGLNKLAKAFKYVVTCIILQNSGVPFSTMAGGFFEETDGAVSKTIGINDLYFCITVFGLAV